MQTSELAQMATKGNLEEFVTTCERSWVQASPWEFFLGAKKKWVYPIRRRIDQSKLTFGLDPARKSINVLKDMRRCPRSGIEESQLGELNSLVSSLVLSNSSKRWSWSLCGSGIFTVKSAREFIDQHILVTSSPTRWSKACNDYGVVVDAFIPYKKSKAVIVKGLVYWVRTKDMEAWDPFICNDFYESESSDGEEDAKDDGSQSEDKVTADNDVERDKVLFEDPFNLYDILNKRKDSGDDLKYPHGFTPSVINVEEVNKKVKGATSNGINEYVNSTLNKLEVSIPKGKLSSNNSVCSKRVHAGGSILQLMDELVKVGQTTSYNVEGCMQNIEAIVGSQGESNETKIERIELVTIKTLQGNSSFDYALSSSLGNSRASLIDLPLDGYAYTWAYKTANKMSSSNEGILSDRSLLLNELNDINSIDSLEAAQKSKACWAIEGDENTKFFHGILNSKCSQLAIRETLVDGEWIVDPLAVKIMFLKYFSSQFSSPVSNRICFADQFNNRLSLEQQTNLERNVSNGEINSAVWNCGTNNSPGPDGFTFELFRLFSGILIDSSLTLSHLSFADDVIFVDIIREEIVLRTKGINLLDLIRKKVGNELNTLFWADPGLDDLALKHKYLRLYALDRYKQITVFEKINHTAMVDTFRRPPRGSTEEEQLGFLLSRMDGLILTNIPDCSVWSLEATGEFSVKFVRQLIDDSILSKEEVATRRVKVMPIKINVFAWRVRLNKLPTRLNIFLKCINISTIVCPLFHASVKSSSHILFSCPMARHL
uniref:RNA-directed DNA polymerase, eukaryota n=1 Tax=Tanacetum cinerariifolium TaxID=118510 RepID=A0A6L2LW30_TANCI|nr:RNA-directed DNA polymerase, eukaryota [Tanacetum cinerariifolium]